MKKPKKQEKMELLIAHLNQNPDGITTQELSEFLGCNIKTIQNYINDLNNQFVEGVELVKICRGKYCIIDSRTPIDKAAINMEKKVYLKLALEALQNLSNISQYHGELIKDFKLDTLNMPYSIKTEDYQKLNTDKEEVEILEEAIVNDNIIVFEFKSKNYHVEPYRLVNFDGIWYLYGKDIEEKGENHYKTWMLKYIDKVEISYGEKHDTPDDEIDQDLSMAYSAQFILDKFFDVTVKVAAQVSDIFTERNHLPNQISEKLPDGSLLVTSTISTYEDIDPEIKSWIPYIEIIKPLDYREKFIAELQGYLDGLRC